MLRKNPSRRQRIHRARCAIFTQGPAILSNAAPPGLPRYRSRRNETVGDWTCDFADAGPHPAVIVSHPDRIARAPLVNVLIGSSQKASRPARENEVVLNGA